MGIIGQHLFARIEDFPKVNIKFCLEKMLKAVPLMGARVVGSTYTENPDQAYVVLSTSHIALHVIQREKSRFAFIDIFTCGRCNPEKGYLYLRENMGFSRDKYHIYKRRLFL